jgi:hypothetical protein
MKWDRGNWLPKQENSTPRGTFYGWLWTGCAAVYFIIFLIPDSLWISHGIVLPEETDLPDFIWTIIRKTPFPVSVYVFWSMLPFFVALSFSILIMAGWPALTSNESKEFKSFLAHKERKQNANNKEGKYIILGCFVMCIACYTMYMDPTPETNPVFKNLKLFQNKFSFFLFYGGGPICAIPIFILAFILECRYFFFRLTHRR